MHRMGWRQYLHGPTTVSMPFAPSARPLSAMGRSLSMMAIRTQAVALAPPLLQGLTLVQFSAHFEPCLSQETPYTPYTPYTPPDTPLARATQPLRAPPMPYKALKLS